MKRSILKMLIVVMVLTSTKNLSLNGFDIKETNNINVINDSDDMEKQDFIINSETNDEEVIIEKGFGDEYDSLDDGWLNDVDNDNLRSMPMNEFTNTFFVYLEKGDQFLMEGTREFESSIKSSENLGVQLYDATGKQVAGTLYGEFNNASMVDEVTFDILDYTAQNVGVYRIDMQGLDPDNLSSSKGDGSYNIEFGTKRNTKYYYHNLWAKEIKFFSPCAVGKLCETIYNATSFDPVIYSVSADGVNTEWNIVNSGGQRHRLSWSTKGLVDKETCDKAPVDSISIGEQYVPFANQVNCENLYDYDVNTNAFLQNPFDPKNNTGFELPERFTSDLFNSYIAPQYKEISIKIASAEYNSDSEITLFIKGENLEESVVELSGNIKYFDNTKLEFDQSVVFDKNGDANLIISGIDKEKMSDEAKLYISIKDNNSHYLILSDIEKLGDVNVNNLTFGNDLIFYDESYLYDSQFCTDDKMMPFFPIDNGAKLEALDGISSSAVDFGWSYPSTDGDVENCIGRKTYNPNDGDDMVIHPGIATPTILNPVSHNNGAYSSIWTSNPIASDIIDVPIKTSTTFSVKKNYSTSNVDNTIYDQGDDINYELEIENTGEFNGNVKVKDELNMGNMNLSICKNLNIEVEDSSYTPINADCDDLKAGNIEVTIKPKKKAKIKYTVDFNDDNELLVTDDELLNNVEIDPTDDLDGCLNNECSANTQTPVFKYEELIIKKNHLPSDFIVDDEGLLVYNISIENIGTKKAVNQRIVDEFEDAAFNNATIIDIKSNVDSTLYSDNSIKSNDIKFDIRNLEVAPKQLIEFNVTIKFPSPLSVNMGAMITNNVMIDTTPENISDPIDCKINQNYCATDVVEPVYPIIEITKDMNDYNSDGYISNDENIEYILNVKNTSDVDAVNVLVKDEMTELVAIGAVVDEAIAFSNDVELVRGDIISGIVINKILPEQEVVVKIPVSMPKIIDSEINEIKNNASAKPENFDPSDVNEGLVTDEENSSVLNPNITIKKDSTLNDVNNNSIADVNETINYVITASNNTLAYADDVRILDNLDDDAFENSVISNLKVTDANGNVLSSTDESTLTTYIDSSVFNGELIIDTTQDISGESSVSLSFDLKLANDFVLKPNGLIENIAIGDLPNDGLDFPENCGVDELCSDYPISDGESISGPYSELVIEKKHTDEDGYISANEELIYEIAVTNISDISAKNVFIQDPLTDLIDITQSISDAVVTVDSSEVAVGDIKNGITIDKLEPGKTAIATVKVKMNEDLKDGIVINNSAQANSSNQNPDLPNFITDSENITSESPEINISKTVSEEDNEYIVDGDIVTYNFTLNNISNVEAQDVRIVDNFDDATFEGAKIVEILTTPSDHSFTDNSTNEGDLKLDIVTSINAMESVNFAVKIKFSDELPTPSNYVTSNIAIADLPNDNIEFPENCGITNECGDYPIKDDEVLPAIESEIRLVKSSSDFDGDNLAEANEIVTYKIEAQNISSVTATDVVIKDSLTQLLSNGVTLVDNTTKVDFINYITGEVLHSENTTESVLTGINIKEIGVSNSAVISFDVKMPNDVSQFDSLENSASGILGNGPTPSDGSDELVTGSPKLTVEKIHTQETEQIKAGETVTYVISVTNNGNAAANNVQILDNLNHEVFEGAKLSNIKSDKQILSDNSILEGDLNLDLILNIEAMDTALIQFDVTFSDPLVAVNEDVVNLVIVDDPNDNINPSDYCDVTAILCEDYPLTDSDNLSTPHPQLDIKKTSKESNDDGYLSSEEEIVYTIEVSNDSGATAINTVIKDDLKEVLNAGGTLVEQKTFKDLNKNKMFDIGEPEYSGDISSGITVDFIENGDSIITHLNIKFNQLKNSQIIKNTATATPSNPDPNNTSPTVTDDNTIEVQNPNITLEKSSTINDLNGNGVVDELESINYNIEITNDSNIYADNVLVFDNLDDIVFENSTISNLKVVNISGNTLEKSEVSDLNNYIDNSIFEENILIDTIVDVDKQSSINLSFDVNLSEGFRLSEDNLIKNIAFADLPNDNINIDINCGVLNECAEYPISDRDEIGGPFSQLVINKKHNDSDNYLTAGETLTYEIEVENISNVVAENVVIQDLMTNIIDISSEISEASVFIEEVEVAKGNIIEGISIGNLQPKQKATAKVNVKFKNDLNTGLLITNTAQASSSNQNPNLPDFVTDSESITSENPQIVLSKSVSELDNEYIVDGDVVTYNFTIKNISNVDVNEVRLVDNFDDKTFENATITSVVSTTPNHEFTNNSIVEGDIKLDINTNVAKNETVNIAVEVKFSDDLVTPTHYPTKNIALVDLPSDNIEFPENCGVVNLCDEYPISDSETLPSKQSEIKVLKSSTDFNNDDVAQANEIINYKIEVQNISSVTATDVVVKDSMSELLDYGVSLVDGSTDISIINNLNNEVVEQYSTSESIIDGINIGELNVSNSVVISFDVKMPSEISTGDVLKNTASATLSNGEAPNPGSDEITVGAPKLSIEKTHMSTTDLVEGGQIISYVIKTTNDGNSKATDIRLTDELNHEVFNNASLINIKSDKQIKQNNSIVEGDLKLDITYDLDEQSTSVITFDVLLDENLPHFSGDVINMAILDDPNDELDPNQLCDVDKFTCNNYPLSDEDIISNSKSKLEISKVVTDENDGNVSNGEQLTYTIQVSNNSNVNAINTVIQDDLKDILNLNAKLVDQITFKDLNHNQKFDDNEPIYTGNIIDGITVDTIKNSETVVSILNVQFDKLDNNTVVKNTANASAQNSSEKVNASAEINVVNPDVELEKTSKLDDTNNNGFADEGETITYNINVNNTSLAYADDVLIFDNLDDEVFNKATISNFKVLDEDLNELTKSNNSTQEQYVDNSSLSNDLKIEAIVDIASNSSINLNFDVKLDSSNLETITKDVITNIAYAELENDGLVVDENSGVLNHDEDYPYSSINEISTQIPEIIEITETGNSVLKIVIIVGIIIGLNKIKYLTSKLN